VWLKVVLELCSQKLLAAIISKAVDKKNQRDLSDHCGLTKDKA
jgi:hypothetical protein